MLFFGTRMWSTAFFLYVWVDMLETVNHQLILTYPGSLELINLLLIVTVGNKQGRGLQPVNLHPTSFDLLPSWFDNVY